MSFDDEQFQREQQLLEERRFLEEEERRRLEDEDRLRIQTELDEARRESPLQPPATPGYEPPEIKGSDAPFDSDAYVEPKAAPRKPMTEEDYQKERDDLARESKGNYLWVFIVIFVLLVLVGGGLYIYFTFFSNPAS